MRFLMKYSVRIWSEKLTQNYKSMADMTTAATFDIYTLPSCKMLSKCGQMVCITQSVQVRGQQIQSVPTKYYVATYPMSSACQPILAIFFLHAYFSTTTRDTLGLRILVLPIYVQQYQWPSKAVIAFCTKFFMTFLYNQRICNKTAKLFSFIVSYFTERYCSG